MKKTYLVLLILISSIQFIHAQNQNTGIQGTIIGNDKKVISDASILIDNQKYRVKSDGTFLIDNLSEGEHDLKIYAENYKTLSEKITVVQGEIKEINFDISKSVEIEEIIVYGNKAVSGLDVITRLPLNPRMMPQNISVITSDVISKQGALTITDAVRNIPNVTLFGTYGGVRESMSIRGYRGTPVLKNGIQIDSDFRTAALLSDMQGVGNIQVLRGSVALTEGIGNGLGSPGGVINVITKKPTFVNAGKVAIEGGSWGFFRPTLDYQTVLDKNQTAAVRINAAFQRADSYKPRVNNNRIYVNPSFEWKPDDKTTVSLEMDYMNDNTTPDRGTVNLAPNVDGQMVNGLYDTSKKFLGWSTDNNNTKTTTYSAKIVRKLTDKLSLRALYAGATNDIDSYGVSVSQKTASALNLITRALTHSASEDINKIVQIDLVGKDLYTGKIKHTFQTGFDFKLSDKTTISYGSKNVDVINILNDIPNVLPSGISNSSVDAESGRTVAKSEIYGLMAQDVVEFNKYIRANVGLRYSLASRRTNPGAKNEAWDPFIGLMVSPIENVSVFGNFTTTTDLRAAANQTKDGSPLGASVTDQFEVGVKSDWFDKKIAFNAVYYHIKKCRYFLSSI